MSVDRRRFILESPICEEWYFGERTRWWTSTDDSDAVIPPLPPRGLFWLHSWSREVRTPYIDGDGSEEACLDGSYGDFICQHLMPPCPRLSALDTEDVLQREDLPDEDGVVMMRVSQRVPLLGEGFNLDEFQSFLWLIGYAQILLFLFLLSAAE